MIIGPDKTTAELEDSKVNKPAEEALTLEKKRRLNKIYLRDAPEADSSDSEDEELNSQNDILKDRSFYCRDDCNRCISETIYKIKEISEVLTQDLLLDELNSHNHPKSRKLNDDKWRDIETAREELIKHYVYRHNKVDNRKK